jgi:hypothetical protein
VSAVGNFLGTVAVVVIACAALLFLGGLASAWLEIRREKRAGVPVTRPAWEARDARREAGGYRATVRGLVKGLRS